MAQISLGNHAKIVARRADQPQIRRFYQEVLGCELATRAQDVDFIRFKGGFVMAVLYQDDAPPAEQLAQAIWLELRSDQVFESRQQILAFGVRQIAMPGAEHIYFHAPGGQVFRLVGENDDLSRFES